MVRRGQNLKVELTGLTNKLEVDYEKNRKINDDSKDLEENHSMEFSFLLLWFPESHLSLYKLELLHSSLILTISGNFLLICSVLRFYLHGPIWREYTIITPILYMRSLYSTYCRAINYSSLRHSQTTIFKDKNNNVSISVCQTPGKIPSLKLLPISILNEWMKWIIDEVLKCSDLNYSIIPYYVIKYVSLCNPQIYLKFFPDVLLWHVKSIMYIYSLNRPNLYIFFPFVNLSLKTMNNLKIR